MLSPPVPHDCLPSLPEWWSWHSAPYGKAVEGVVPMCWVAAHDSGNAKVWPDQIWTNGIRGAETIGLIVSAVAMEQAPSSVQERNAIRVRLHHVAYAAMLVESAKTAQSVLERQRNTLLARIDALQAAADRKDP